jgi:inorganic triphosphatase YgiF
MNGRCTDPQVVHTVHLGALQRDMPTHQREVERKYDVDAAAEVPDLTGLPGVVGLDGPATVRLEATYFDTADLALGRRRITLRRRTGAPTRAGT